MEMKRGFSCWVGLAVLLLAAPSMTKAEELSYSTLLTRIETLEAELEEQRTDFASYSTNSYDMVPGDYDCGCSGTTWSFGYELMFLRPYVSNITLGPGFNNQYGLGHRLTLGAEGSGGVGARVRYMTYEQDHAFIPPAPVTLDIDVDMLDAEMTLRERMRNWDLLVSGGFRYGRNAYNLGPATVYFEGTGPTVSLEATREFGTRGFYLVGNARGSLLIGRIVNPAGILGGPPVLNDELTTMLEGQLGIGWARELGRGELHVRALWETQFLFNDTFADPFVGLGSDLGLSGITFGVEYRL